MYIQKPSCLKHKSALLTPALISLLLGWHSALSAEPSLTPTTVQVITSAERITSKQTLRITAEVYPIPQDSGIPTGNVEFFDGPVSLGSTALTSVDGVATASLDTKLAPGVHPLIVKYPGDGIYAHSLSVPPKAQLVTP